MMRSGKYSLWAVSFLVLSITSVHACINPVGRSTVGGSIDAYDANPEELLARLLTHEGQGYWIKTLAELQLPGTEFSLPAEKETNTAVAMLHLGLTTQAITILEEVERTNPDLYYTAVNLGTAYELNGQNEKALEWIRRGIRRNVDAHNGSEWLHVKILEAKVALAKDPNWLAKNSVLELQNITEEDAHNNRPVAVGNGGKAISLTQVQEALIYQLHERLEFIKPPEGVVADLLFDLSRTLALTRSLQHSETMAAFAQTYGDDLTPWPGSGPFLPTVKQLPVASMATYWMAVPLLILLVAAVFVIERRRKRAS